MVSYREPTPDAFQLHFVRRCGGKRNNSDILKIQAIDFFLQTSYLLSGVILPHDSCAFTHDSLWLISFHMWFFQMIRLLSHVNFLTNHLLSHLILSDDLITLACDFQADPFKFTCDFPHDAFTFTLDSFRLFIYFQMWFFQMIHLFFRCDFLADSFTFTFDSFRRFIYSQMWFSNRLIYFNVWFGSEISSDTRITW